jgi:hypothetical protein
VLRQSIFLISGIYASDLCATRSVVAQHCPRATHRVVAS